MKGVRVALVGVGILVTAISGFAGLQVHEQQYCVEETYSPADFLHLFPICARYQTRIVGYSLADWSFPPIAFGFALILLGVGLLIYPRLKKEVQEELRLRP